MKNKKIIYLIVICVVIFIILLINILFTGCAYNKSIIDLDYKFTKAIVYENGEWVEYQIKKWDDYENDMVCIWTSNGKVIYSSSVNIILYG